MPGVWLEPGHWFDGLPEPPSPYFAIVAAFFSVALVASLVAYLLRRQLFPGNAVLISLAVRLGPWAITAAVIGVLLAASRYGGVPYFSARFLWVICAVALLGLIGYVIWFLLRRYPQRLAAFRAEQVKQRYLPRPNPRRRSRRQ